MRVAAIRFCTAVRSSARTEPAFCICAPNIRRVTSRHVVPSATFMPTTRYTERERRMLRARSRSRRIATCIRRMRHPWCTLGFTRRRCMLVDRLRIIWSLLEPSPHAPSWRCRKKGGAWAVARRRASAGCARRAVRILRSKNGSHATSRSSGGSIISCRAAATRRMDLRFSRRQAFSTSRASFFATLRQR